MTLLRLFVGFLCLCIGAPMAQAHEVNPAYLEVTETAPDRHAVVWKQPLKDGMRLRLTPVFPETCVAGPVQASLAPGIVVERWQLDCDLTTGSVRVTGLERTLTDAFVRVQRLNGDTITAVLRAGSDDVSLDREATSSPATAYLWIGVEHIWFGYDHLLFVLGMVLLVRLRQLFLTITAFTIAHSITLALSALAGVSLPGAPVEITIALSIVLLAREAIGRMRGEVTLSQTYPWLIAFGFGLIHGFGFSGALASIGLPKGQEVLALLLFNLGVELGQLAFIAVLVALGVLAFRLIKASERPLRYIAAYGIGIAGTYWALERIAATFFLAA